MKEISKHRFYNDFPGLRKRAQLFPDLDSIIFLKDGANYAVIDHDRDDDDYAVALLRLREGLQDNKVGIETEKEARNIATNYLTTPR